MMAPTAPAQDTADLDPGLYAHFDTTLGEFMVELYEEAVPRTVGNFVNLATGRQEWRHPVTGEIHKETPYYDGILFHRIIDGFMIQTGDPSATGMGGPGYRFPDEFVSGLRHNRAGMLSMANSGPDTNGSQFFITLEATPHLDGKHSVFGRVVDGMDVIRRIGGVRVDRQTSKPLEDIAIEKVTILRVPKKP